MNPGTLIEIPATAPHAAVPVGVSRTMLLVCAALLPGTLYGFSLYGWPAFFLWLITVLAALLGEAAGLRLGGRRALPVLKDGSAALTGWLLAVSLPPWAPWWVGVLGGLFSTLIAKQVFGGLGSNLFNPAMVARVFLLISFPVPMTQWIAPYAGAGLPNFHDGLLITLSGSFNLDAVSSASLLGYAKTELSRGVDLAHSLAAGIVPGNTVMGSRAGSLGETSALLIAAGGLALLALRIISWHIPVAMFAGVALPAMLFHAIDPARYLDAWAHIVSGGVVLGAFFIATDYVTSPNTAPGQLLFGFGCGFLTYVIRTWGGYPEGVAFAVLLMNALTPIIDRYVQPRVYGRDWKGTPLDPDTQKEIVK